MPLTEIAHFIPREHRPATIAQVEELRDEVAELRARLDTLINALSPTGVF